MWFFKEIFKRYLEDEIPRSSAELAYFFLLSLFPFLLFLLTLIAFLPIPQSQFLSIIEEFAPIETMNLIKSNLSFLLSSHNEKLLGASILAAIWSASNGIMAIVRALNIAYDVKESRSFLVARLMAIMLTFAMIFVIIIALLLPVFGKIIGTYIFTTLGMSEEFVTIWNTLRWAVSSFILFSVFTYLYYFAPNKKLKMNEVILGSIFATIGWAVVSLAFSYYVNHFGNYSAMYGSIGAIIVLMIWFYLSGMILLLGGEINAMMHRKRMFNHH